MNWLNVNVTQLRDGMFGGADPTEIGIWLRLAAYCASQENGGVILGCVTWTERQWQTTCGLSLEEVQRPSRLWQWGVARELISIYGYPKEQEAIMRAKRAGGKRGAKRRWKPKNIVHMKGDSEATL